MNRLSAARHGTLGTILFYGYLVAILVTGLLIAGAFRQLEIQDKQIKVQAQVQARQQVRSCLAIKGAADFWRKVRASTRRSLVDSSLSPQARQTNVEFIRALDDVINRADSLSCKSEEK